MSEDYGKLLGALKRRLPASQLELLGRKTSFVRRLRRVTPSLFVWAVVFSRFGTGRPAFERARHWFTRLSGLELFPRPFQMRFKSAAAVKLFEAAFEQAVSPWRRRPRVAHVLGRHFPDVVVWDTTPIQLDDSLRKHFRGLRKAASQIKVLLGLSVFGLVPLSARLVGGNRNDHKLELPTDLLQKGTLVLFDKGFVAYDRLRRLGEAHLKYLCPMRIHAHAWVTQVHAGPSRAYKALKSNPSGFALRDLLPKDKRIRTTWDLQVMVRPSAHDADHTPVSMRLVIVPGPKSQQRPYVTNLDTQWRPEALRELYRLRWQVELVFKEMKQNLNLETVPTKDPHAAQVLIWASLIALTISRTVACALGPIFRKPGIAAPIRPSVVTRELRSYIPLVAHAVLERSSRAARALEAAVLGIIRDALRPRAKRPDSFAILEKLAPLLAT